MDKISILDDGVWELEKLKDQLITLNKYKEELTSLDVAEQKLEQEISQKEMEIDSEIINVVSKRESEITKTYEDQLTRQKNKIQKVEKDKLKNKDKKVKERIKAETASLCEENEKLAEEASYAFREKKVAGIFNTRFYYAMFTPKGISDFLIDFLFLLVTFFIIPKGAHYIKKPENQILFWILTYVVITLVVAVLYYIAYHATKLKAPDAIEKGKELNYQIRLNTRKIKKIKRGIMKDKDESIYQLDSYNEELQKLQKKQREIELEKNTALATLKNTTSNILANEVRNKYEEEMKGLTAGQEAQKQKIHENEEKIRELTFTLANKYQAYLGTELMNEAAVDELIAIMNQNDLRAISEALPIYHAKQNIVQNNESVS